MSNNMSFYEEIEKKIKEYETLLRENYMQMDKTQMFYNQGICAGLRMAYREMENIDSDD